MAFITGPMQFIGNNVSNVIYLAQDTLGSSCMTIDNMSLQQPILISYPQVNTLPNTENISQDICDLPQLIYNDINNSSFEPFNNISLPETDSVELESGNINTLMADLPQLVFNDSFNTNIYLQNYPNIKVNESPLDNMDMKHGVSIGDNIASQDSQVISEDPEAREIPDCSIPRKTSASCKHCGKIYINQNVLKKHILKFHNKQKKFHCEKCTKCFDSLMKLILHELDHWESGSKCPLTGTMKCNLKYSRKAALSTHFMKHHIINTNYDMRNSSLSEKKERKTLEKNDEDTDNPYLSDTDENLSTEIKKVNPNTCKFCAKTFDKPSQLIRHVRIHSGEKPFKCQECGTRFSQKYSLVLHRYTHLKLRPYQCSQCPAAFSQTGNLQTHMRRVHPKEIENQIHNCPHCNSYFRNRRNYNLHFLKFHGNSEQGKTSSAFQRNMKSSNVKEHPGSKSNILQTALATSGVTSKLNNYKRSSAGFCKTLSSRGQCRLNPTDLEITENAVPDAPQLVHVSPQISFVALDKHNHKLSKPDSFDKTNYLMFSGDVVEPSCGELSCPPNLDPSCLLNTTDSTPLINNNIDCHNKISCSGNYIFPTESTPLMTEDIQDNSPKSEMDVVCLQNEPNCDNVSNSINTQYYVTIDNGQVVLLKCNVISNMNSINHKNNVLQEDNTTKTSDPSHVELKSFSVETANEKNRTSKLIEKPIRKRVMHNKVSSNKKIEKCFKWPPLAHKCDECPGSFAKPSDLIRHRRIHTGEKPFTCSTCNRKFSLMSTLTVHVSIHKKAKKLPKSAHRAKKSVNASITVD